MDIILYSAVGSNSSERVEWALNYKSLPYKRMEVPSNELSTTYLKINPFGYVPTISIDGILISESMAIIECLEELYPKRALFGQTWAERAAIREVCEYVNSSIHAPQNRTVLKAFRPELTENEKREFRGSWIVQCLTKLSPKLWNTSNFAIGSSFSVADIFVASIYKKSCQHGAVRLEDYDKYLNWLSGQEQVSSSEPKI
ncbi:glutathione S-transferase N-terminal domain-containing protein [Photobacterium profundum]